MQFEGGGVGVAGHGTVGVGGPIASRKIGVHVSGFVAVVVGELLEEGGHEVVGDLRVRVLRENAGRIDVLGHRVHAHPRQLVHSREFVLVVRLVLVEDDGHVERIVRLFDHAGRLDLHRSGGGRDVPVRQVIQVREGLRTVGRGRVLWWEGGPDVTRVLPLGPHHEIDLSGIADGRPRKGHFSNLVARPTDVTVTREGMHVRGRVLFVGGGPAACTVRHDRMVGRILEHERVVSREGQDVREAPIGRQGRAAFAGVEVHEEVRTFL